MIDEASEIRAFFCFYMLRNILKLDLVLISSVILLAVLSLLSLYSMSLNSPESESMSLFAKQAIFVLFGLLAMAFFSKFNYHYLRSYSTAWYLLSVVLLVLVIFIGSTVRGTVGWLGVGSFHIQPVEIAKLGLIIFLAAYISRKKMELSDTSRMVVSFLVTATLVFLVLKQPDFGSAMILAAIWIGMMIISGLRKKVFAFMVIIIILFGCVSWLFLEDYQKERVIGIIEPQRDPKGSGYNVIQSTIAIGSGGLTGKGIGYGSQSQLNFLPEKHNDFIFAVISEELGLAGSFFLLVIYTTFFYRLKEASLKAPDNFGYLLICGFMMMFCTQFLVNVGMNIGIVPVTGISLPFVSYGGSFLLISFISVGIVINVSSKEQNIAIS